MNLAVEVKYMVRLMAIMASLLFAMLGILSIFMGIVNLARLYPITIFICVCVGYLLAVMATRILFPARDE